MFSNFVMGGGYNTNIDRMNISDEDSDSSYMDTPGEDMPSDTNRTIRNNLKMLLNSQTLFSLYNLDQESHHKYESESDTPGHYNNDNYNDDNYNKNKQNTSIPNKSKINSKNKNKFSSFMDGHPSYHSHHVNCLQEINEYVPNFIGGSLPQSDQGDRDYYFNTMLTLFKPWQHGNDLRRDDETWEDAFNRFYSNPHQQELMKFFNLRYECLDE